MQIVNLTIATFKPFKNYTVEQFKEKYPHPFLIQNQNVNASGPSNFTTQAFSSKDLTEAIRKLKQEAEEKKSQAIQVTVLPDSVVHPIKKREGNLYPDKFFVGRTMQSDICINNHSISKTHAYFTRSVINHDQFQIVDHNSTNGCVINSKPLVPNKPQDINDQDTIIFGNVSFSFVFPETFLQILKEQM